MNVLQRLKEKRSKIIQDQREMYDLAESEKREFTSDEETKYQKMEDEFDELTEQINSCGVGDKPIFRQIQPDYHYRSSNRNNYSNSRGNRHISVNFDSRHVKNVYGNQDNANYVYDENGTGKRDAFNRYLKYGERGISNKEFRALQADSDKGGGFLVTPVELARSVIIDLDNEVFIRDKATVYEVPYAQSLGAPALDTDVGDLEWTAEIRTGSEDSDMDFDRRDLYPHPIARRIKVSNKLLRNSTLMPEEVVKQRLIFKAGAVQENAFINGDGVNKPLGVFVADNNGISTSRDFTGSKTTEVTGDDLINLVGTLKSQYRKGAEWIVHRNFQTQVRRIKGGDGQYIWKDSLDGDAPDTLLGFPINLSEYAPSTFTASQYVAVLGNLKFYWIVDALNMEIQRLQELYAETNQTGFIIRVETDGMPIMENAFARLKLAAS